MVKTQHRNNFIQAVVCKKTRVKEVVKKVIEEFMMNKKRFLFLSKLILILVLTGNLTTAQDGETPKSGGCVGNKSKTAKSKNNFNKLTSRRWNLIEIRGAKTESSTAFVEFNGAEKRFAGNAGCNRMFGKFVTNGNEIKLSEIGTTKIFCSQEGVMKLESDFIKALETVNRFEQTGSLLNFYAGNDLIVKFSAEKVKPDNFGDSGLAEKKWILTSIAGKSLPKIKAVPFMVFDKQKQSAGGDSGCNSFGGNYKTEADKISFSELISTQRACIEDERANIEREFLGGLQKANRFEISSGKLNLYESDALLLTFVSQDENQETSQNVVTFNTFGAVKIGMTVSQASKALGVNLNGSEKQGDCYYVSPKNDFNDIGFMVNRGSIARFDISESGYKTDRGAKIGTTEDEVKRLYEGLYKVSPHKYVDGHYITIEKQGGKYGIIFETDGKTVTSFRAGRFPEVGYIEGCS